MELCRLCHSKTPPGAYKTMFIDRKVDDRILEIIKKLTDIKISKKDPFPKIVCHECYDKLINFYMFRESILHANSLFYQEFSGNNNDKDQIVDQQVIEEDPLKLDRQQLSDIIENIKEESSDDIILDEANEDFRIDLDEINNLQQFSNNESNGDIEINIKCNRINKVAEKLKKFTCRICQKGFISQTCLDRHTRMHSGERPYSCNICGKSFSQKITLTEHSRAHTGERPFVCVICNKSFYRSGTLKVHMRTHTGERPYNCNVCGRDFSVKVTLTRHLQTHTKGNTFDSSTANISLQQNDALKEELFENEMLE